MEIQLQRDKKELLENNNKTIMDSDDKIIIYPFLYYSNKFDNKRVYDLFKKKYDNWDALKIDCTKEEALLAESILRVNVDINTGIKCYDGLIHNFVSNNLDENITYYYTFKCCAEKESCIFFRKGEYFRCFLTSVEFKYDNIYSISFGMEKIEGKLPDFNLPKLCIFDKYNNFMGEC